jgi:RNA polymerase sigma-70 factor (ECF subfamily)
MRDLTLTEIERLRAGDADAAIPLEMDEESFRGFYDRTARTLRAYLARVTGDAALADDLLQEAYYRFLRAGGGYEGEAHRRNALFRIATNLIYDSRRRARVAPFLDVPQQEIADRHDEAAATERAADLRRAMARLKPRERALLWLAYAHGSSHKEIAESLGLRAGSVKLLLFRARRRLAALLTGTRAAAQERIQSRRSSVRSSRNCWTRWPRAAGPIAQSPRCARMSRPARCAATSPRSPEPSSKIATAPAPKPWCHPQARSGGERRFVPVRTPPAWRSARC